MNISNIETEEYLPVTRAARYLNVHPNTLRSWERQGKVKCKRIGVRRDRRFARKDLAALLKDQPVQPRPFKHLDDTVSAQELISLTEAARFTSYSPDYLGLLARSGHIGAKRIGRYWVTTRRAVEDYVKEVKAGQQGRKAGTKLSHHLYKPHSVAGALLVSPCVVAASH